MESELIPIREAARRLGVSDTAIRKAIAAGRVSIAGRTETSDRPLLAWPQAEQDWLRNTNQNMRSHVGNRGSKVRKSDPPPVVKLLTNTDTSDAGELGVPGLNESKAKKEKYLAELARIDFEKAEGKLMEVEKIKASAFKVARTVRDGLLNLPDRIAHELAHETEAAQIHKRLMDEIRTVLEALAQSNDQIAA